MKVTFKGPVFEAIAQLTPNELAIKEARAAVPDEDRIFLAEDKHLDAAVCLFVEVCLNQTDAICQEAARVYLNAVTQIRDRGHILLDTGVRVVYVEAINHLSRAERVLNKFAQHDRRVDHYYALFIKEWRQWLVGKKDELYEMTRRWDIRRMD